MDVQALQRDVMRRMLSPPADAGALTWKLLIFDKRCMGILGSLFHVQQLQKLGVTVMMKLEDAKRERIEDTPAVYFIAPTKENIDRVAKDCKRGLYDTVYLNFCYPLSRMNLKDLAQQTVENGAHKHIAKVYDQYADFISLDRRLVTLNMPNSFCRLTRPKSDQALMSYVDRIVDGLFSILVTLQQVPIIRASPGNAAALAAERLHLKFRQHLMSRNNLFSGGLSAYKRPLVILLDRNMDLSVPLHHPWTYCSLVNDIFSIKSNKVDIPTEEKGDTATSASTKSYDLSSEDAFWDEYQGAAFPKVAEGVQKYLNEYNAKAEQLKKDQVGLSDLKSAVNSMPELMKKKRMIDAHTNIATALLKQLKERHWDRYFELEEELIQNMPPSFEDVLEQLQPDAKGTPSDKLRLYLIYSLLHNVSDEEDKKVKAHLKGYEAEGLDLSSLNFLKNHKMEQKFTAGLQDTTKKESSHASGGSSLFTFISDSVGARGKKLLQGVRNLIPADKSLPTTKLVEALMENKGARKSTARFLYFDPKLQGDGPVSGARRITTPFTEGFVFVMGGGNYVEHQNLQDYAKRASNPQVPVSIAYGSTEILSGTQFLQQLSTLGKPPSGGDVDDALD
uniref:Sec1 family domain-containing protein 1 n=1 Tax=Bigelowiella natans TaxID=227086 RepID=A0A7S2KFE3_BIGNA|eukprot:jgi/Bigna1/69192/fgenesh1_pg.8_\